LKILEKHPQTTTPLLLLFQRFYRAPGYPISHKAYRVTLTSPCKNARR